MQRAQVLASTDPVAAIGLLRELAPSSPRWRDAWLAAVAAWSRGIPSGVHVESDVMGLETSFDGRRAIATLATGQIVVLDLIARTQRTIATLHHVGQCHWVDAATALCNHESTRYALVDTERGDVRAVAVEASNAATDRRSRAILQTRDKRLVELAADGTTHELTTGVELATSSSDLSDIFVWRGTTLELWRPSGSVTIASFPGPKPPTNFLTARDHVLGGLIDRELYQWHVDGSRVVEDSHGVLQSETELMFADARIYTLVPGAQALAKNLITGGAVRPASMFPTPHGVGVFELDGSIALIDARGWFRLGPYPTRFLRADLSLDGRYLVAATDLDDVLVWDLDALRPHTMLLDKTEIAVALIPPYLWTLDQLDGVRRRIALADRVDTVLGSMLAPNDPWMAIGEDGKWAAIREPSTDRLIAYDATRDQRGYIDATTQAADAHGIAVVRADGLVARWEPGHDHVEPLGRLAAVPINVAADGAHVIAAMDERRLARLDPGLPERDSGVTGEITAIAMQGSRAWIVTADGALWRWDEAGDLVRVPLGEAVSALAHLGPHMVGYAPHSLVVLDVEPPRELLVESRRGSWMGDDYVATVMSNHAVAIVDLTTGSSLALRMAAVNDVIAAHGDTIAFEIDADMNGRTVRFLDAIAVPHEPAALQRWVAKVTNATLSKGGGAWPVHDESRALAHACDPKQPLSAMTPVHRMGWTATPARPVRARDGNTMTRTTGCLDVGRTVIRFDRRR